jgi:hypothetical protein
MGTILTLVMNRAEPDASPSSYSDLTGAIITPGSPDNPDPVEPEPQPVEHEAFSIDSSWYDGLFSDQAQGFSDDVVNFPVTRITDLYEERGNLTLKTGNEEEVYVMVGDEELLTSLPLSLPGRNKLDAEQGMEQVNVVTLPWVLTDDDYRVLASFKNDEQIVFFTTNPVVATYKE